MAPILLFLLLLSALDTQGLVPKSSLSSRLHHSHSEVQEVTYPQGPFNIPKILYLNLTLDVKKDIKLPNWIVSISPSNNRSFYYDNGTQIQIEKLHADPDFTLDPFKSALGVWVYPHKQFKESEPLRDLIAFKSSFVLFNEISINYFLYKGANLSLWFDGVKVKEVTADNPPGTPDAWRILNFKYNFSRSDIIIHRPNPGDFVFIDKVVMMAKDNSNKTTTTTTIPPPTGPGDDEPEPEPPKTPPANPPKDEDKDAGGGNGSSLTLTSSMTCSLTLAGCTFVYWFIQSSYYVQTEMKSV